MADLYDPLPMPVLLPDAQRALDQAVDRRYLPERSDTDRQRVEFLFGLYERLRTPLVPPVVKRPGAKRADNSKTQPFSACQRRTPLVVDHAYRPRSPILTDKAGRELTMPRFSIPPGVTFGYRSHIVRV